MFRMLLGCYQVGSIPANLDEVLVGSLDAMRALRSEYLLVLGADEGAFPAFSQAEGLLSDSERRSLLSLGVTLSPCAEERLERELGWTQLALQSARKRVWLISGSEQPSYLMARTKTILPRCGILLQGDCRFVPDRRALAAEAIREGETWPLDPLTLQKGRALRVEARPICGLPVCVFPALWVKTRAVAAGKL